MHLSNQTARQSLVPLPAVFNIFQVVRFRNGPCNGTSGDAGICYTAAECDSLGGNSNGECASGFGVCCQCEYKVIISRLIV